MRLVHVFVEHPTKNKILKNTNNLFMINLSSLLKHNLIKIKKVFIPFKVIDKS